MMEGAEKSLLYVAFWQRGMGWEGEGVGHLTEGL